MGSELGLCMWSKWSPNKKENSESSQKSPCFLAPGKPTDLRVSSVRDLTITLKWKKPLTTAGTPDNSTLSYMVSYTAVGSNTHERLTVKTESAQLDLTFDKQYNIYVKAIRSGDHQIQSDWSDPLKVNTKDLGKFESFYKSTFYM